MIETTSPEAIRAFLARMRPVYRPRLSDALFMVLMLGLSEYHLVQIAMNRVSQMADVIDLLMVLACVVGAVVTAVACSILVTGSLHRQHCRLTYQAFPPFFNWSVEDDCVEALRFVPITRGYILRLRRRGETKFRLVAINEAKLSQDIVSFVKEARSGTL